MIFTSNQAPSNSSASLTFRDRGNKTDAPTQLSDVILYGIKDIRSTRFDILKANIHIAASALLRGEIVSSEEDNFFSVLGYDTKDLLPAPGIGISFGRKVKDDTEAKVLGLGFTKDAMGGNNVYYRGHMPKGRENSLISLGSDLDTWVPVGITNLRGYMAYVVTTKVIVALSRAIPAPAYMEDDTSLYPLDMRMEDSAGKQLLIGTSRRVHHSEERKVCKVPFMGEEQKLYQSQFKRVNNPEFAFKPFIEATPTVISRLNQVPAETPGCFFPYFNGLLIPDSNLAPSIISRLSTPILGSSATQIAKTLLSVRKGWKSLSSTSTGMALSHMLYCLDLALQVGGKPLYYIKDDSTYLGTIICGSHFQFVKPNMEYSPVDYQTLLKEISAFDAHDSSVIQLAELLSGTPLADEEGVKRPVLPEQCSTPRRIHDFIRERTISKEKQAVLKELLNRMNFVQEYWDGSDATQIAAAITLIVRGQFPGYIAPIPYKGNAIFTKNVLTSVLAAFGTRVPSFIDPSGPKITIPLKTATDSLLSMRVPNSDQLMLKQGIPIFHKSLEQAVDDWRKTMQDHVVGFRTSKSGNPMGTSTLLRGDGGALVDSLLCKNFGVTASGKTKKRKERQSDDIDEDTREEVERARLVKKRKIMEDTAEFFATIGAPLMDLEPELEELAEDAAEMAED